MVPCVIWLTGLSGAGKSTIARALAQNLTQRGEPFCILDGDHVRHGLCADLGFSRDHRKENIRRVGEVAKLLCNQGIIPIAALISPYCSDRQLVREMMSPGQFVEVYVNAPLAVCEQRDPKGFYAKARLNQLKEFTGVSAPYEPPLDPEIELQTDKLSVAEAVAKILQKVMHSSA
jgi:adenylyl-sulfate kinase